MKKQKYNDKELLEAIKSPGQIDKALDFMYQNYHDGLVKLVLSKSGNREDAEDMIQEAFIVFIEMVHQGKYQGKASIKSFLYTLVRNLWVSAIRKKVSDNVRHQVFEEAKGESEEDITSHIQYREGQQMIIKLLETTGEQCLKILKLFYYEGLSMKEIRVQTDYENEQTLRNKKYKCLKSLIEKVGNSPEVYQNIKSALQYGK